MLKLRIPYFRLAWLEVRLGTEAPAPAPVAGAAIRLTPQAEPHPLKGRLKPGWSNTLWHRRTGLYLYEWARRYHTTGPQIRHLLQAAGLRPPYTQAQIEAHPKMFRRYIRHQQTGMIPMPQEAQR